MPEDLVYHLLRAALEQYQKPPVELNLSENAVVMQRAKRARALEQKILSSATAEVAEVAEEDINASLNILKSRFEGEARFANALRENGLDEQKLYSSLRRDLQVEQIVNNVTNAVAEVSNEEATQYYHRHHKQFIQPELRRLRHILITVNSDYSENKPDSAYIRIQTLARLLRNNPMKFADVARRHSECPTALSGGMLGQVPRGVLYPELDDALFRLQPGRLSDVIRTEVGFHLVLCESVVPEREIPLPDVLPAIRERLLDRRRRVRLESWINSLP